MLTLKVIIMIIIPAISLHDTKLDTNDNTHPHPRYSLLWHSGWYSYHPYNGKDRHHAER
jgi:hypothetical protein